MSILAPVTEDAVTVDGMAFRLLLRHGNPRGLPRDMIERMYRDFQDPAVQRAVLRLYRATDRAVAIGR